MSFLGRKPRYSVIWEQDTHWSKAASAVRVAASTSSAPISAFYTEMAFVQPAEGGYTDTPGDPGGPTNFGITLATLAAWRAPESVTAADVQALTWTEAEAIYQANYWNAMNGDLLPGPVAISAVDMGINAGVGRAAKQLQAIVGAKQDGGIGPMTLASVNTWAWQPSLPKLSKPAATAIQTVLKIGVDGDIGPITTAAVTTAGGQAITLVGALYDAQAAYYVSLNDPEFQAGWLNRAAARLNTALAFSVGIGVS